MDPELIAYLEERFRETSRQTVELRKENNQLRHATLQIAEGLLKLMQRQERFESKAVLFGEAREWMESLYELLDGRLRAMENPSERRERDAIDAVRKLLVKLRQPVTTV